MHIAVAIPTFNRVRNLKLAVEGFLSQRKPNDVTLSLIISNSASTDGTYNYLKVLKKKHPEIYIFNDHLDWDYANFGCILDLLPNDADWVWLMGDDDKFHSSGSIEKLCEILRRGSYRSELAFVHACASDRSTNTGNIHIDSVLNLCKRFGYIEMLGWFSSLIVRRNEFAKVLSILHQKCVMSKEHHVRTNSAFHHSRYLLEQLYDKPAAFFDEPLVEEQQDSDKTANQQRWLNENMGERYLFIVDDLLGIKQSGIPLRDLENTFFKYHRSHLWDRFMIYQIDVVQELVAKFSSAQIDSYLPNFWKNWSRIDNMATFFLSTTSQKQHIVISRTTQTLCKKLLQKPDDHSVRKVLLETRSMLTLPCYDYKINFSESEIFRP